MDESETGNPGRATSAEEDQLELNVTECAVNVVTRDVVNGHQTDHIDPQDNKTVVAESGSGTAVLAEGEIVTQKFENSDINVVSGDLIQGDKIINIYNQTSQGGDRYGEQGARPKRQKLADEAEISSASENQRMSRKHSKLCKVIKENAKRMTAGKITADFDCEMLNEPEYKVYPEMLKVGNFFKGGYKQIVEEMGFHSGEERARSGIITLDELFKSINRTKKREDHDRLVVTAIVASAGSGKTTLMKRIARKTLEHSGSASMDEVAKKMIHYIELKHIRYEERQRPAQFLFEGLFKDSTDEDEAFNWLCENQSDAILFFDGLDQATWKVDKKTERKMRPFQNGNTAEIMYNLLSGNVLPHVKIIIASREFSISELPFNAQPAETITLIGLTRSDAQKLFVSLIGEEGQEIWHKIENMSPRLLLIISVPVFLILTAIIMALDPNSPPPRTVTELYNRILLSLRRSEHIQEREQVIDVINKLKGMAHQGMEEGRVMFYQWDLKKFGVSMKDVRDLMMKVPGNNILSRHLLEGDFVFFFCHQSLQEFLSASFVSEMEFPEFASFNDKCLHENRCTVVRRFVSGIIHDESDNELHNVSDAKLKQKVFLEAIQSRSLRTMMIHVDGQDYSNSLEYLADSEADTRDKRERLATIYESNNDSLIQSLPSMPEITWISLSADEAHMFGSILARRKKKKEKEISFNGCYLNDELIDIMVQNLKGRKIPVETLDLRSNKFTRAGFNTILFHFDADEVELYKLTKFRYQELDWNNIRQISFSRIRLINEQETVVVKEGFEGRFNKQAKSLLLRDGGECRVSGALEIRTFFQPVSTEFHFERLMYTEPRDFDELQNQNIRGKIAKMLIDCTYGGIIDTSLSFPCLRIFKVENLDIVGDELTSFLLTETEIRSLTDISVNIHWTFQVSDVSCVTNIIPILQRNKVENLRLHLRYGNNTKEKDIFSIIENCQLKKLTLVHENDNSPLSKESRAVAKFAQLLDVEFEKLVQSRERDAWYYADNW